MRILIHSNVIIPCVAQAAGEQSANSAGWIEAVIDGLMENEEIELGVICPGRIWKSGGEWFL